MLYKIMRGSKNNRNPTSPRHARNRQWIGPVTCSTILAATNSSLVNIPDYGGRFHPPSPPCQSVNCHNSRLRFNQRIKYSSRYHLVCIVSRHFSRVVLFALKPKRNGMQSAYVVNCQFSARDSMRCVLRVQQLTLFDQSSHLYVASDCPWQLWLAIPVRDCLWQSTPGPVCTNSAIIYSAYPWPSQRHGFDYFK